MTTKHFVPYGKIVLRVECDTRERDIIHCHENFDYFKLRPRGHAYRDKLVSERLNLERESS
jgi:hypothetical protein